MDEARLKRMLVELVKDAEDDEAYATNTVNKEVRARLSGRAEGTRSAVLTIAEQLNISIS